MLQSLYIQNYALINKLDIHLNKGLSIITGETGAGKSIIVGALSLISGQRADMSLVRDNTKKCIVEATFDIKAYRLQHFFEQYGIDYEDNTIIRREINPSGKSRAFINDSPFDSNTLKELGDKLVDIHSQHQNLNLKNNLFQLKVVDTLANHHDLLEHYKEIYKELQHFKKQYNSLKEDFEKNKADIDYYQYQFDQIDKAALKNGEQEDLENELNKLDHAEEIKTNLSKSSYLLNGEGETVLDLLKEINEALFSIKDFFPKVNDCSDRLNSSYIELKDLASEISMLNEEIEFDPQRLEEIRERLDL